MLAPIPRIDHEPESFLDIFQSRVRTMMRWPELTQIDERGIGNRSGSGQTPSGLPPPMTQVRRPDADRGGKRCGAVSDTIGVNSLVAFEIRPICWHGSVCPVGIEWREGEQRMPASSDGIHVWGLRPRRAVKHRGHRAGSRRAGSTECWATGRRRPLKEELPSTGTERAILPNSAPLRCRGLCRGLAAAHVAGADRHLAMTCSDGKRIRKRPQVIPRRETMSDLENQHIRHPPPDLSLLLR